MTENLEPLDPSDGVEMYLQDRERECAESTLNAHRSRLRLFVRWCDDEAGIDNLNDVTGRDIHRYKLWRQQGIRSDGVSGETLRTALLTVRVFHRWAVSVDAVPERVPENIVLPDAVSRSREEMLDADSAKELLAHLSKYSYASHEHVIMRVLWRCGMRAGALRALDVSNYDSDEQYLHVQHRPETDTPLKNGEAGQRHVALASETSRVLDDYLDSTRPDVTDEYGRDPLIGTTHGRRSLQSLRGYSYYWSSPCRWGDCPHGRDSEDCEAAAWMQSNKCPSSVSTHPIRRGAVTHHLSNGVPTKAVSDKMDVSPAVLSEHYDERDSRERMEQRKRYLDNI